MESLVQALGEDVTQLRLGGDPLHYNVLLVYLITDEVITDVNVFGTIMNGIDLSQA
jgi:hypothetical protein